ncbi:GNAT family N-acetyltransferase [Kribbella qitaiheensis]|uniref:GNAT family N-acetyltransferase n=1 Tax=Kribbella qitaiheensis TaxID=1544730 RepID=UPI00360C9F69
MAGGGPGRRRDLRRVLRYAVARWTPLLQAPSRHGWLTSDDEGPVGFIDLEILDGEAEITYYVSPARRRQGLGRTTLAQVVRLATDKGARQIHAGRRTHEHRQPHRSPQGRLHRTSQERIRRTRVPPRPEYLTTPAFGCAGSQLGNWDVRGFRGRFDGWMVELDAAIRSYYRDRYVEDDRLSRSGHGRLEFLRTQDLLRGSYRCLRQRSWTWVERRVFMRGGWPLTGTR